MIYGGYLEYLMSLGLISSFIMMFIFLFRSRRSFDREFKRIGLNRRYLIFALLVVVLFVAFEVAVVKPTQQLFFDDAIYQGMALDLIHTGQAWMCNYGTPTYCIAGQIFHEPIGEAFNIAIAFLLFGVSRSSAYIANIVLTAIAVGLTFFLTLLLFEDRRIALLSELMMAVSPIILLWAAPTTSDIPMLTYSLLAIIGMLIFLKRRNIYTLGFALLSFSLLSYMKVDAIAFAPLILIMYIILDKRGVRSAIRSNISLIKRNIMNTNMLIVILIFVLVISPNAVFVFREVSNSNFGAAGTNVQLTCASGFQSITAQSKFGIGYFEANLCDNVIFWFDRLAPAQVVQPVVFTVIAIFGAAIALYYKRYRKAAISLIIWFVLFFVLYTSFYAGGVNYGVDWRFMLSLITPVAIFGGVFLNEILAFAERLAGRFRPPRRKRGAKPRRGKRAKYIFRKRLLTAIGILIIILIIAFPAYGFIPIISMQPRDIQQAASARFYENFVYNSSYKIPSNCLVFSFDPMLFNLNNRSAVDIQNFGAANLTKNFSGYGCYVIDVGYWCGTPSGSICASIMNSTTTEPIATAKYFRRNSNFNFTFGFYKVINASS